MSTLNVSNISDGTDTVETGYVVNGSAKAWGQCDDAGTSINAGTFNVSSIADNGSSGKDFNLTSSFSTVPLAALGGSNISVWGNTNGFITKGTSGINSNLVSTRYYKGTVYSDTYGSFLAHGDLA
jgi:hypothetical protein